MRRNLVAALVLALALAAQADPPSQETAAMSTSPVHSTVPAVTLRREGNRVWLAGAKELFHQHFDDTKAGRTTPWAERCDTYMYLTQMRIAGWDVDYATLNTVAGYGPSFAYAPRLQDKWNAHYHPLEGRDDRIAHATGCRYRWQRHDAEQYWQALKRAIDEGHAVHGPNAEGVLFIGYVDAEDPADRKVLPLAIVFVGADEWTWEQFSRWVGQRQWFGRIEGREEPWPVHQSATEVIKMMVRVARGHDSRRKDGDGVVWGIDGIEAYAADLADLSKSGAPEREGGYFQGGWRGCHNVYPQMSGRPAAATYLRKVAPAFGDEARPHVLAAAEAYEAATGSWREFARQLGRGVEGGHTEAWTGETNRTAGAAAVRQAAAHEREAIAALKQALAADGIELPPTSARVPR